MTLGSLLTHMGIGTKQLTERFSPADYGGGHDTQIYAYEPPSHAPVHHVASSKHHHGGGGHKNNAAMSALTLLAFLFFLHILQQCLKDQMNAMTTTAPIVVMTAGREGEEALVKMADKLDKLGVTDKAKQNTEDTNEKNKVFENPKTEYDEQDEFTKISVSEHTPIRAERYRKVIKKYGNESFALSGYVSAMDVK